MNSENLIVIDFSEIGDMEDFYAELHQQAELPGHFGDNLDALSDWLTGGARLPLTLEFENLAPDQLETFEPLIEMLEELAEETEGLDFTYFMQQFEG